MRVLNVILEIEATVSEIRYIYTILFRLKKKTRLWILLSYSIYNIRVIKIKNKN